MEWKKYFEDWKLIAALVLVTLLCTEAAPHVEIFVPDFVPSTAVSVQISGGYQTNVTAQIVSNHSWFAR